MRKLALASVCTFGPLLLTAFALLSTHLASAQSSYMSLGSVTTPTQLQNCPSNTGFASSATCYSAKVTGCPNDDDMPFVYGVSNAGGTKGTIVLLAGLGGGHATEAPGSEVSYTNQYTGKGYQVIQLAWGHTGGIDGPIDWELTNVQGGTNNPSIRNAACRPATFLHWVRYGGLWAQGGMCAQGFSAGAGATSYSLAWYGAGDATIGYLDKVELLSGPELADLEQGCEVPSEDSTPICQSSQSQFGCVGWTTQPNYSEEFTGAKNDVETWSGGTAVTGPACANNSTITTYDSSWLTMSLMDFTETEQPSFNYPKTAMAAWLCETTAMNVTPNNSGAQGELFYLQFSSASQAGGSYSLNAVTGCPDDPENVNGGTVASTGDSGFTDISNDMVDQTKGCVKRH